MKNWRTTAMGYTAAGLQLYANGIDAKHVLFSVALALLGHLAKDYNISNAPVPVREGVKTTE